MGMNKGRIIENNLGLGVVEKQKSTATTVRYRYNDENAALVKFFPKMVYLQKYVLW